MAKPKNVEICPYCHTLNPLAEYVMRERELSAQRYRWPDYDRLLRGIPVVETLGYSLYGDRGYGESIDLADHAATFADWLAWTPDQHDGDADSETSRYETKRTSATSFASRPLTRYFADCRLRCGCVARFELARRPTAERLHIAERRESCPAHRSISGYAMDMRGRCYVCEWPITPAAKALDTKLNRLDETYCAIPLAEETR